MVSIVIPARTERYLNKTIESVLKAATGEIEIFVVLDGYGDTPYEPIIDKRVKYISLPLPVNYERRKRQGINAAISISYGKYVMWLDAHCVLAEGFDEVLAKDCEDDWIVVPRRMRLDPKTWTAKNPEGRPPIDYEYFMWQYLKRNRLAGYKWEIKSRAKTDVPIDDIMVCQGSLVFMSRKHYDRMGFMKVEGYTGWGQEGEEVCLTTILNGGRAVVNKNTWYAHLHKGQMHGRMYKWTNVQPSYNYSFNYWVNKHRDFFVETVNRFMPLPNYTSDWEKRLYG